MIPNDVDDFAMFLADGIESDKAKADELRRWIREWLWEWVQSRDRRGMPLREVVERNLTAAEDTPGDMEQWAGWEGIERLPLIDCLDAIVEHSGDLSTPNPDSALIAVGVFASVAMKRLVEIREALQSAPASDAAEPSSTPEAHPVSRWEILEMLARQRDACARGQGRGDSGTDV